MTDAEVKKALQVDEAEKLLPLVLEILPGHAAEGLIDIYKPGSYEGISLRKLCDRTLSKKNLSIEEQLIVEDVTRQLEGGKLLSRGQEIDGTALEYAVAEQTEAGEKYLYVPIRAIKPQEGGYCGQTIAPMAHFEFSAGGV
ncbi:MAG: hypothetical protein AMK69_21470 [Nitrospira bacterium SG8_3]|nr:MAG: hypothetical protein AMK69_21470 [Nitrospira bacterium SG8_3]